MLSVQVFISIFFHSQDFVIFLQNERLPMILEWCDCSNDLPVNMD
jgi:hypothetical protein